MDLLAAITAELRSAGTKCRIATALGTLSPGEADDLRTALADLHYSATAISRGLQQCGVTITPAVIQHHRRQDCHCG